MRFSLKRKPDKDGKDGKGKVVGKVAGKDTGKGKTSQESDGSRNVLSLDGDGDREDRGDVGGKKKIPLTTVDVDVGDTGDKDKDKEEVVIIMPVAINAGIETETEAKPANEEEFNRIPPGIFGRALLRGMELSTKKQIEGNMENMEN